MMYFRQQLTSLVSRLYVFRTTFLVVVLCGIVAVREYSVGSCSPAVVVGMKIGA